MGTPTFAEALLDLARSMGPSDRLVIPGALSPAELARCRLALEVRRRPALALRAVVEGWGPREVVRNVY